MAFRTFNPGYQTIAVTNTAQPLISTTLNGAVVAQPDPQVGQNLLVASSALFRTGDWVIVDVPPNEDRVLIAAIPDATHITLHPNNGLTKSHVTTSLVRLSMIVTSVYVQSQDGGTNALFICSGPSGKIDGTLCRAKLQNVAVGMQPVDWRDSFTSDSGANPIDVGEIWIVGTNPDKYLPSFGVV